MLTTRRFVQSAALLAAAPWVAACGRKEEPPRPATVAAATAPARAVVVGTDAEYPPFESRNDKGEIVGMTVDVLEAVANKAGLEVRFVHTPWEGLFSALQQGDRDMLASSIPITAERRQTMDFSDPYFDAAQLIAVKQPSKVTKFDDLKKLKVGVQTGTTGDELVSGLLGRTSTAIKRFGSTPLALEALERGGVDAVVGDNGVVIHHLTHHPGASFRTVGDTAIEREPYGFAVKKGNAELLARLNQGLAAIKADGSYDRIYASYFGARRAAAAAPAASQGDLRR